MCCAWEKENISDITYLTTQYEGCINYTLRMFFLNEKCMMVETAPFQTFGSRSTGIRNNNINVWD